PSRKPDHCQKETSLPENFRLDPPDQARIAPEETQEGKCSVQEDRKHIRHPQIPGKHCRINLRLCPCRQVIIAVGIVWFSPVSAYISSAYSEPCHTGPGKDHGRSPQLGLPPVKRIQVDLLI